MAILCSHLGLHQWCLFSNCVNSSVDRLEIGIKCSVDPLVLCFRTRPMVFLSRVVIYFLGNRQGWRKRKKDPSYILETTLALVLIFTSLKYPHCEFKHCFKSWVGFLTCSRLVLWSLALISPCDMHSLSLGFLVVHLFSHR